MSEDERSLVEAFQDLVESQPIAFYALKDERMMLLSQYVLAQHIAAIEARLEGIEATVTRMGEDYLDITFGRTR